MRGNQEQIAKRVSIAQTTAAQFLQALGIVCNQTRASSHSALTVMADADEPNRSAGLLKKSASRVSSLHVLNQQADGHTVRERTIPTERPLLLGKVVTNFGG
jgi:hypothetical protein